MEEEKEGEQTVPEKRKRRRLWKTRLQNEIDREFLWNLQMQNNLVHTAYWLELEREKRRSWRSYIS